MTGRKKSAVWTHFRQTTEGPIGSCNICKANISFRGGSTANLHRHLKTRHPWVRLCEVKTEEEAPSEAHPGSSRPQTTSGDSGGRGQAIGPTRLSQSRPMTPAPRQETLDGQLGPRLPFASLRLLLSPVRLVSGAIWHTVQHHVVSDYGMLEEFVSMVTDLVPELLSTEQKTQLLQRLRARNGIPGELGCSYDDEALVNVTWQFLSRLEKLFPLQTIQQVALMLADIPSALEECLKSVSHRGELQTLLGCRKGLLDKNGCPLDGARETSALHLCVGDGIKAEQGHQAHSLPDVHRCGSQIEGPHASTAVAMSEDMEAAVEKEAVEEMSSQGFMDAFGKDCLVLLKRLEDIPAVQRGAVRSNRGLKRILLQGKNHRRKMTSKQVLPRSPRLIPDPSNRISIDPFPSVTYIVVADDSDVDSVHSLDVSSDVSYVVPVGSDSGEDSLSDCSNTDPSFVKLASPKEGKKPLVTRKKHDTEKICLSVPNSTSTTKGLCLICNKHVQTDMKEHMTAHFPDGVLTCPRCDMVCKNMHSLKLHFKRVCFDQLQIESQGDLVRLHQCDGCERSFKYRMHLNKHKIVHNQLYCEICERVVRDAETLARHKVSHTPFQCTLCEKNFGVFKHLASHCKNVHQLSKPYECHHCPKVFSKFNVFIGHEWQHTGQLPFQCSQCSMTFKQDAELAIHLRVHTHEKPFLCKDCGKRFACNSNLTRHSRMVHNESSKVQRSLGSRRSKEGARQKPHQKKRQMRQTPGPCKYCGTLLHSSRLCPQMSLSDNQSSLPHEMEAKDGSNIDKHLSELVSLLQAPSHVAPSQENLLSSYSTDRSSVALNDLDDGLVALKEQDAPLGKIPAANKTNSSTQRRLCFLCKKHVRLDNKEQHMKTHFPDGILTCPRCDALFKSMASLRMHFKRVCVEQLQIEPGENRVGHGLFKCDQCEKSYRYKLALDGHKRTHNQLYCEVCRRVLRDAETLARHKVSHTPFQCTLCEKDFGNFKQLSRHYESTHKLSKPYKCHHCPKVFSKLGLYIRHEWKHTGQLPFQCSHCAMKFKQDTDLAGHLRVHTHEKPYLCTDCGKTFSSSSNLFRHVKFRHSESREIRRFTCTQCSKTFKEKGSLQKHEQRKHQNHKKVRHPCTYCGKMFSQSWLAGHQMIHTGEKPLECPIPDCDQRFRSTSGLKNHSLLHHTAERPFECNTCGKGFIRASILKQHMEIHSGEKNHVCLVCGKAFLKAYSMARHVKLVHSPK